MTNKQVSDLLSGDIPGTARHTIKQQQEEIKQLKAKLELCREALQSLVDECPYYIASVGEPTFSKVSAAMEAIEGRDGE